jgi:hypothetical protein
VLPLASFEDGAVAVSLVYDSSTLAVTAIAWSNTTGQPAPVTVTGPKGNPHSFNIPRGSGSHDLTHLSFTLVTLADGSLMTPFDVQIAWGTS